MSYIINIFIQGVCLFVRATTCERKSSSQATTEMRTIEQDTGMSQTICSPNYKLFPFPIQSFSKIKMCPGGMNNS